MTVLDLQAIRLALASQIRDGIANTKINVYAYLPESPKFPLIAVVPRRDAPYVSYHESMGRNGTVSVSLEVVVASTSRAEDAQILIDSLLSVGTGTDSSISDVIEADRSLGGVVGDAVTLTATVTTQTVENAGLFEAVVPVDILLYRDA